MNFRIMVLFIFIVVFRSYGSEFDKELTMVRMERHLIIAKNGQSLDFPGCDAHAITIDYFQKTGTGEVINKKIINIFEEKYRYRSNTNHVDGGKWDYCFAKHFWGFCNKDGSVVFMLCFFESSRYESFWGITGAEIGVTDLSENKKEERYQIKGVSI